MLIREKTYHFFEETEDDYAHVLTDGFDFFQITSPADRHPGWFRNYSNEPTAWHFTLTMKFVWLGPTDA